MVLKGGPAAWRSQLVPFQDSVASTLTQSRESRHIVLDKEINRSPWCQSLPLVFFLLFLGRHWMREKSCCCQRRSGTEVALLKLAHVLWGLPFKELHLGQGWRRLFFTHHTNAGSFLLTCLWDLTSLSTQGLHRKSVGTKYNCFCFKSSWLYLYALNQLKGQSRMLWCSVFIFQITVPLTQGEGVPCPGSGLENWSLPNLDWVDWFLR